VPSPSGRVRRGFKLPHTLALISALVLGVYLLTLVLPAGRFDRQDKEFQGQKRQMTVPGTYHRVDKTLLGPQWLLIAPLRGFEDGVLIIALIFIFGGSFAILSKTGAIEAGIHRLSRTFAARPGARKFVIPVLMVVFSLAGATYGMAEEAIPFVLIFIPFALALGYDSIVGVAIPFLGSAIGFSAAFFNPFTVGIAQGFADLPLYSGLGYRLALWVIGTAIATIFVARYAERVRKDPRLSLVYDLDRERGLDDRAAAGPEPAWGASQKIVLGLLLAAVGLLVYGILVEKWYMEEIAALFLGLGILSGIVGRLSASDMATSFIAGAKDVMNVTLIIAVGRAILIILKQAEVLDTVLQYSAVVISAVPRVIAAHMMFSAQMVINFFVHSGTAQAALTMPLMAPLGDLVGITRQTVVLAFQLCEVINPILPTSAVTMGVLGVAKIPWEKWAKWFLPLMLILILFSLVALVPAVLTHYGPF
jgi:uncharacterized ion transporter superfamily protein YfcC